MFLESQINHLIQKGSIEVICGSMFSGKTEELLRRLKRAQFAKLNIAVFKPKIDKRYDTLKESIRQEGFNEEFPIVIMLRRENNEDKLFEGHHRLNIAIELGLATVPVRFMEWQKEYNAKGNWVEK